MALSAQDKSVLKWFGLSVLIYLAVVDGGSVLYMIIATAVPGLIAYNEHALGPETLGHPLSSFAQYALGLLGFGLFFGCSVFSKSARGAPLSLSLLLFTVKVRLLSEVSLESQLHSQAAFGCSVLFGTWPVMTKRFGLQPLLAQ